MSVSPIKVYSTETGTLDDTTPVTVDARGHTWTARIHVDKDAYVLVSAADDATADDYPVFATFEYDFAVAAAEQISILGTEAGKVWISEVKASA